MKVSAIVLLSGGLDSAVLAYDLRSRKIPLKAFSMRYGQKHEREIEAAKYISKSLSIEHQIVDLSAVGIPLFGGSTLTNGGNVPHGHHEAIIQKSTIVPNRNMVMIALAVSLAIQSKATRVYFACHKGDAAIYNDCRGNFLQKLGEAIRLCDDWETCLHFPFIGMEKREIAELGRNLGVPFDTTWTCYEGGETPCGKCGACTERNLALNESN